MSNHHYYKQQFICFVFLIFFVHLNCATITGPLRWGIAASGKISNDFVNALTILPKDNHTVVAIAARSQDSADEFARKHGIPTAYGGYERLAEDPDVDVIYLANLNPDHYETAKMFLEHKKNVLCEKPMTLNIDQTKDLIRTAKRNDVFLQEGIWSRSFPAYKALIEQINNGTIGEVQQVNASFGWNMSDLARLTQRKLGGGSTLDVGIYTLQLAQLIFKPSRPMSIKSVGKLNADGVDESMSSVVSFWNGKTAYIESSIVNRLDNDAIIIGTEGEIYIPDFWSPEILILPNDVLVFPLPDTKKKFNYLHSEGLSYEAQEVRECLLAGKKENPSMPWKDSIILAAMMDEIRSQIGVFYTGYDYSQHPIFPSVIDFGM